MFFASDGKKTSEDSYTAVIEVTENTAPYLMGAESGMGTVDQYADWTLDLEKVFGDQEANGVTYTVKINGEDAVSAAANYTYAPQTSDTHTFVFQAKDSMGLTSPEYTFTLTVKPVLRTVIDTNCTGSGTGDTWVKNIIVTNAQVESYEWENGTGHAEGDTHTAEILLAGFTAADAVIDLAYTGGFAHSGFAGSITGPASLTLENGKGSVTVTTTGWMGRGTARTYVLNFSVSDYVDPNNNAPAASSPSSEVNLTTGEAFSIDLSEIFTDVDGDTLFFSVAQGEETAEIGSIFSKTFAVSGTYTLVFTAADSWNTTATHTVTVNVKTNTETYDLMVNVPQDITPVFCITGEIDGENGDELGEQLAVSAGTAANGFVPYTVKVPKGTARISFRGEESDGKNWGGMSVAVSEDMAPVTLVQVSGVIPSKVNGSYATAEQAVFRLRDKDGCYAVSGGTETDAYGIVNYRFLVVAWGTEDLAKAYTSYVIPLGSLTSKYVTSIGANKTFEKDLPKQITQLNMTLKSGFSVTAPEGAKVQLFNQNNYYNSPEIFATSQTNNGDGTVTWAFEKGNSMYMSYRISMEGKITKAGWVSGDKLNVNWDETDASPKTCAAYDTSTLYGSRGDDSLVMNINGRNNLVMNSGENFRLRAYRIWEVINSDTNNVMIQPDMNYTLTGDNIVTVTPVSAGNAKNNWLDLRATGTGVAYLEMSYDAMKILTGNMSGWGGAEIAGFTFNACDPARTGLAVIQVGNAASDVSFGIQGNSKVNSSAAAWDAEFDTLYFLGEKGQLTLSPSVASGSIAKVEVSNNKGVSWTALTAENGTYTADIASGNNIIRITKDDGTQAYQVVRGDKITVSTKEQSGDGDNIAEAGETIRIQLHGLHNPIGKMSGNYNPGYGAGQHITYRYNDTAVTTSVNYQYDFVSNAWVDVTIPETAQPDESFALTNGYIYFNVMGIANFTDDKENHRGIGDGGCGTRGSGPSTHQRSILPELTLTVGEQLGSKSVETEGIALDQIEVSLEAGSSMILSATVTPTDATDKTIIWKSSDVSVATVENGTVTAIAEGTAIITASTTNGKTAACTVTVTKAAAPEPELTFDLDESEIVGYVTVGFEDHGVRLESDLPGIAEQYKTPLGTIIKPTKVPFKAYDSIASVTLRLLKAMNISAAYTGAEDSAFYLSSIGNFTVDGKTYTNFGEFNAGAGSGWMVTQNDNFIGKGASEFFVRDGDEIRWQYTCRIGADIGDMETTEAIKTVEKLIDDIGAVTLDSEKAITDARKAYDELASEFLKKQVSNYNKLTAAEKALAELKATDVDKDAADAVEKLIDAIGEVTKAKEDEIEAAREAYEALTGTQKKLVEYYAKLIAAENLLVILKNPSHKEVYKKTGDYMESLGTPDVGSIGGDWMALGLARSDRKVSEEYYAHVVKFVEENVDANGRLDKNKSTENSRIILALTSLGYDVTNVAGHNLFEGLTDMSFVKKQGINGPFWALVALDSHDYELPAGGDVSRETLLETILSRQTKDGGWTLAGETADADMTGMALTALAPYYDTDAKVKSAVDKALAMLSETQLSDGSFGSIDGSSAESCAQVVSALSALGINPHTDERFIKNGISVVDALCNFALKNGGFQHIMDGKTDGMATEQSYYALAAYFRMLEGKTDLFDMSDVEIANPAETVEELIDTIGKVTADSETVIKAARAAYDALSEADREKVGNYKKLKKAEEAYAEIDAKISAVEKLIDEIGTVKYDDATEERIKAARKAFNKLSETEQKHVENLAQLTDAEELYDDLQAAQEVIDLIDAIGEVTEESEADIEKARKAYNKLSKKQKALVTNYSELTAAERKWESMDPEGVTKVIGTGDTEVIIGKVKYMVDKEAAELMKEIIKLNDSKNPTDEMIIEAYKIYAEMTDKLKAQIFNYDDLEALTNALGVQYRKDETTGMEIEGDGLEWYIRLVVKEVENGGTYTAVAESIGSNELIHLWDIELVNVLTGESVQPADLIKVRVPSNELAGYDDYRILHYSDDGRMEYLDCEIDGGYVMWEAEKFSHYALIGGVEEALEVLAEDAVEEETVVVTDGAEEQPSLLWLWILIGVIGIAAIVLVLILKSRKNDSGNGF